MTGGKNVSLKLTMKLKTQMTSRQTRKNPKIGDPPADQVGPHQRKLL